MVDKSIVGTEMGGGSMVVERGKIMEFARAILDENPAYFQENDAPAPLTFTMAGAHWPTSGGGGGAKLADLGLDLLRVLHAGQEYEYLGEIKAGDSLTSRSVISDVSEKEGKRGGTMQFVVTETVFKDQSGEVVAYARGTTIQTGKPATS